MVWYFCPHRNTGRDLCLLVPQIREQQVCRYCFPGESSSWLYPVENTKMNGAVGPKIRQVTICLRFPGGEGVWSVADSWTMTHEEDHALEQGLCKAGLANSGNHVERVGTKVLAEQKGTRMKVVRNNQAKAGRCDQVFSS